MDDKLRDRMVEGSKLIADDVKKRTAVWSHRIPGATSVFNDASGIGVVVDGALAPSAGPNEFAERHPLFGNKAWMRTSPKAQMPHRPFLEEAVDAMADDATDIVANVVDDWARAAHWKDE